MQKLLHFLAFVVTGVIGYCQIVLQDFPILHDFPEWMYQGWIFSVLVSAGESAVAQNFALVDYPVPNSISQIGIGLLNFIFSPVVSGKIWLGSYLALSSVLWFSISRHANTAYDGALHLLLILMITLGPGFWNGYINYQIGLLLFALYLYVTVMRGVQSRVWLLVIALLIYFSHAALFAAFLLFHFLLMMFAWNKHRLLDVLALSPAVLLLIWYASVKLASGEVYPSQGLGLVKFIQYKVYTLAKQGPFHNFVQADGQSFLEQQHVLYQVGFVVNFLVAALIALWLMRLGWMLIVGRSRSQLRFSDSPVHWPVTISILITFAIFLVGGQNSFGVVNPGERFVIVALLMILVFYRPPKFILVGLTSLCAVFSVYLMVATLLLSNYPLESYSVARSADTDNLQKYVGDIYSASRHKYFNHRLYIYADRGIELTKNNPLLLPIDLATSVVINRK